MTYVFDLGRAATNADPLPEFDRLREHGPLHAAPAMKSWRAARNAEGGTRAHSGAELVDYIADFAYPLPASVIMDMLGVPRADLQRVKVWSDDIALFIGPAQVAGNKSLRAEAGAKAMADYFRALVEARTSAPTNDMISQLV